MIFSVLYEYNEVLLENKNIGIMEVALLLSPYICHEGDGTRSGDGS